MDNSDRKLGIAPVAASTEEALAKRKLKSKLTMTDALESVHLALIANEKYKSYRQAYSNEGAVEGSMDIDDVKALEMIRQQAQDMGMTFVGERKLADLKRPWRSALRRFDEGRKQLRLAQANGSSAAEETEEAEE